MDVAVIIPTYYRNGLLFDALNSVGVESDQVTEIIVVDGSGESHAKLVIEECHFEDIELRYIAQDRDRGVASARDAGVEATDCEIIRFLDDDDLLVEGSLSNQMTLVSKSTGVVYGGVRWPDGQEILPTELNKGDVLTQALSLDLVPCFPSTMLVKRELFEKIPPMSSLVSDDIPLKIELAQQTEFETVNTVVAERNGGLGLGEAVETADRRKNILEEYRPLYDQQPDWVWKEAKKSTHLRAADSRISQRGWSKEAIREAAKATYYGQDLVSVGYLASSLFGRPGRDLGKQVYRMIQGKNIEGKLSSQ